MATPPPVTETLARFVAETDYSAISDSALSNAKMHLLDTIGAGLAAVSTTVAAIAVNYCKRMGHSQEASIWGTTEKASAPMAAFTNGLLAHTLDFDDWDAYLRAGHPSSVITAAALALGENIGASGKDFLKAYVFGIEVLTQMAAGTPELHKRGFHSTPVWGSIGGVIASASLLKLDPEKIKAALGVAASGAAGIQRQQGSMVKPFHAGNAARNGVEAALLAQQGFTADQNIIEAPRGFCDTFFGSETLRLRKDGGSAGHAGKHRHRGFFRGGGRGVAGRRPHVRFRCHRRRAHARDVAPGLLGVVVLRAGLAAAVFAVAVAAHAVHALAAVPAAMLVTRLGFGFGLLRVLRQCRRAEGERTGGAEREGDVAYGSHL